MKKIISVILSVVFVLSSVSVCFATSQNRVLQTVRALGIMVGDDKGNMNVDINVTRAEFSKMLIAATGSSDLRDSGTGFSLYSDVEKDHWAGRYIYQSTKKGLLTGYTDSTFRPDNNLKLEEICAGVLRLLGYKASDLEGSYPDAYLDKAYELGLLDNVSAEQGDYVTRGDCANIFYNAMLAEDSSGKAYGTSIGCTVNNGVVTYSVNEAKSDDVDGYYYGVVESVSKSASAASSSGVATSLTISCSDGVSRSYSFEKSLSYEQGDIVQVKVSDGDSTISGLSSKHLSGTVNSSGTKLGSTALASDVGILEIDSYGNSALLGIDDITGLSFSSSDIKYYRKNDGGEIDVLILNDKTGALWTKVYMISVEEEEIQAESADSTVSGAAVSMTENAMTQSSVSGSYTYICNGVTKTVHTTDELYGVGTGGVMIKFSPSGEIQAMKNMGYVKLSSVTSTKALTSGNAAYNVSEDVQVYVRSSGEYYQTDILTINSGDFKLQGYYSSSSNKTIEIIIAYK